MKKVLEFSAKVESTLDNYGLVKENAHEIGLNAANIAGENLIFADLYNEKGEVVRVYCTPNITAEIRRSKFKNLSEVRAYLADKQIIQTKNNAGELRFKISHLGGETSRGTIDEKVIVLPKKIENVEEIPW